MCLSEVNRHHRETESGILQSCFQNLALSLVAGLTEKRKQLQERALLEKISEIAPTYDDAQTLLDLLAAERPSADTKDGGNAHDNEREPPRD